MNKKGQKIRLKCEVAYSYSKKAKGLMYRTSLATNSGMIFVYPEEERLTFWMKNTKIPLSIAFVGKNGIIHEMYDMRPYDTTHIGSKKKVMYAVEVNQGWFKKNHILTGTKISIEKKGK